MTLAEPPAAPPQQTAADTLITRAKNLILQPSQEWERIDGERPVSTQILLTYVLPLAAIPAVAQLIGSTVFGYGVFGFSMRVGLPFAISQAVISLILSVIGVFVTAFIIDALAPNFKGEKNQTKAFQVAAYAPTAAWLSGVFLIFPPLSVLALAGLVSVFTLYRGLPRLMRAPQDQAVAFTAVTIIASAVVYIVAATIFGVVLGLMGLSAVGGGGLFGAGAPPAVQGSINVPGGSVDLGKLEQAAREMERAAEQLSGGEGAKPLPAIPMEVLEAALPESLPSGFVRTALQSSVAGAMGVSGASGTYEKGEQRIILQVGDMGPFGGMAAMAQAFQVQSNEQTADGFKRVRTSGGEAVMEEYSRSNQTATYTRIKNNLVLTANGTRVEFETVKAAAASIDLDQLAASRPAAP